MALVRPDRLGDSVNRRAFGFGVNVKKTGVIRNCDRANIHVGNDDYD